MAHDPSIRMQVRAAYIGGLPLEAAAERSSVPYPTARRWFTDARKDGDDWDKFRAASLVVAGGGIEQAMGRIIAAGLLRCEALLEALGAIQDPEAQVKAVATIGDTMSKLKSAAKTMMPEADGLAAENAAIKGLADLFCRQHPALAAQMLATVEAYANGQR
ncbi:MAG: DUF1804 family protein [Zoogloea sp.]|uniref:DUF1804 family protein n=1 Tax=Zoogloea sp. TaxID=49181 RepID=UPI003F35E1A9